MSGALLLLSHVKQLPAPGPSQLAHEGSHAPQVLLLVTYARAPHTVASRS